MSTARGKIGRLPRETRTRVNVMIRDNATAEAIISMLAAEGVHGITPQNVSAWKVNGYRAWERIQDRLETSRLRHEFAVEFAAQAAADGADVLNLASNSASGLAVEAIQEVLEDYDPALLKDLLAEKPEKFIGLVESLASLRKGDQAFVALKMKFDDYQRRVRDQARRIEALATGDSEASATDLADIAKKLYGV